jgi:F420-dependent oxidoreductase-like protein
MRFSFWPSTSNPWEDLLASAVHAGATGWDGLWVYDHFMPTAGDGPTLECWTVLSALAALVPSVRLGPLVCGNTYRHPAVLAKMASTLDHVSGGRAVLGLGAGWQENEHRAYGIEFFDVRGRLARLEEACAVVRHLLTDEPATYQGRFYTVTDAPLDPKPLQRHLPLLIGGRGEKVTLRIAAQWADEWNAWGTPDVLAQKGAVLDRHCEAIGRDPAEIARSAQVIVDLGGQPFPEPLPTLRGSTAQLQEAMAAYAAAGVSEFILPDWNLGTGDALHDAMDRFLTEVAAPFREAPTTG